MTMHNNGNTGIEQSSAQFKARRKRLYLLMNETLQVLQQLDMNETINQIGILKKKLKNDVFRVVVVGTFKNGKSTFINAIIGKDVLPSRVVPATAVISEVKYGIDNKAILHFINPMPSEDQIHSSIPNEIKRHIQKYGKSNIPPVEIPFNKINEYVTIPIGDNPQDLILGSPYDKVELFWPLEILKNGVELIDSPGLNDAPVRTKVTMDYLGKADAVLVVLSATKLTSQDEIEALKEGELSKFKESTFFIVNRFDDVPDDQRDQVVKYAKLRLSGLKSEARPIYFVSALQALQARESKGNDLFRKSGFAELENALSDFLVKDRGRIKLAHPLSSLKNIVNVEARESLKNKYDMLGTNLQQLERRYNQVKPKLAEQQKRKTQLSARLNQELRSSERLMRAATREMCDNLLDKKISEWINDYNPKNPGFWNTILHPKDTCKKISQEINDYINGKLVGFLNSWKADTFAPLVVEQIRIIRNNSDADISAFNNALDNIKGALTGRQAGIELNRQTNVDGVTPSAWDRVVGAASGFVIGGFGGAITGGVHGVGAEVVKTTGIEIGGAILLYIIGILNPITMLPIIAAAVWNSLQNGRNNILSSVKTNVATSITQQIRNSRDSMIDESTRSAMEQIEENTLKPALRYIDAEISQLENQVNSVLEEKRRGEQGVAAKRTTLRQCEAKLDRLNQDLDSMYRELLIG